ncbi:MAG: cyclic pyranopterin monophosphate synthase MoaC [Lachnospiraceae bacterium]|nr:cyclic pyranopterin monophosphate synthase MoaC [Lachnospiraceae bacterium]
MSEFTHLDEQGNARMVDVGNKDITEREAVAKGSITMTRECYEKLVNGDMKKGDAISAARIAGIMATKRTPDLIPLCHPIKLTKASMDFEFDDENFRITAFCKTCAFDKTGVEMEALTGVSTALLTIYDMCKAVDRAMEISDIRLVRKSGGKSGLFVNPKDTGKDI